MPGHAFDDPLTIKDGCLLPSGPLDLAPDETPVRLDVWIFQEGSACVAVQRVFPDREKWTANPDSKADHIGAKFLPGEATATGLIVSIKGGQPKTFRWTDLIKLVGK